MNPQITSNLKKTSSLVKPVRIPGLNLLIGFFWCITSLSSAVETQVSPLITWVLFTFIFAFELIILRRSFYFQPFYTAAAVILVLGIVTNSFFSYQQFYDLRQGIQLAILSLGGVVLFASSSTQRNAFVISLVFLVFLNAILLFLGWFISPYFAQLATSDGRYQTILNQPGTIGVLAIPIIIYGMYRLSKSLRVWPIWILIGCGITLIIGENSRTIAFQTLIGLFLVFIERYREILSAKKRIILTIVFIIAPILFIASTFSQLITTRVGHFFEVLTREGFVRGLEISDPIRTRMWEHLAEILPYHLFWGEGMGSARVPLYTNEFGSSTIEIHAGAFQLWADTGLLAFLGYISLIVSSLWFGQKALQRRDLSDHERGVLLSAVGISWTFAIGNFLHTYSTEWAQWIYLGFAWGTIIHSNRKRSHE